MADQRSANAGQPTGVRISTDPSELDLDWVHAAISDRSYWAAGVRRDALEAAIEHSLCFGAYRGRQQVGIARVVTDYATFAWICDVFVDENERGRGVGSALMAAITQDPRLRDLRRLMLATRDAHELYARFGFTPLAAPERWMERRSASPSDGSRRPPRPEPN